MSGNGAEDALQLYAGSDFCLQPPGDTLPRPGIIDATATNWSIAKVARLHV